MKRQYSVPDAEIISFRIEEDMLEGDVDPSIIPGPPEDDEDGDFSPIE